jgi:hypothetical protein
VNKPLECAELLRIAPCLRWVRGDVPSRCGATRPSPPSTTASRAGASQRFRASIRSQAQASSSSLLSHLRGAFPVDGDLAFHGQGV